MGYEKIYFNIGSLSINEIDKFYKKFYSKNIVLSLFQETYSQTVYKRYFGNNSLINPKADFNKRLKTAENWINVGFRNIDIGILLGLCEPSNDINQLIIHANKLYKLGAKVHISLPRIRGVNNLKYEVNDDKYIEIIKFIKHKCPWASLIVTTRESVDLIKKSLEYITIVSPGSSDIAPYTISGKIPNNLETSQFVINKNRERPSQILDKIGYKFRYYKEINN